MLVVKPRIGVITASVFLTVAVTFGHAALDKEDAVALWLLDDVAGGTTLDISGNGLDGMIQGAPDDIDGKFAGGLELAGGSGFLVEDVPELNFDEESFSVTIWFQFDAAPDWGRLVRDRNPSPWGSGNAGWELQTQGLQVHWSLDDVASTHMKNSYADAGNGEWRHTAMIVDRENDLLITYLDGIDRKEVDIEAIDSVTGPQPVTIGDGFPGMIDEIGIFNVALTEDDVITIMESGLEAAVGGAAVEPEGKAPVTWAAMKLRY
jgi:hypothetical protein